MTPQPFRIGIDDSVLEDLQERLTRTWWTSLGEDAGWSFGMNLHFVRVAARGVCRLPLLLLHGWPDSFFRYHKVNLMVYWATGSIGTAFLPHYDVVHAGPGRWIVEKMKDVISRTHLPAGFALFPNDTAHPPREWAERFFHVQRWTPMPRGGHFAAMEEPELLAAELREFFRPLRLPR